MTKDTLDRYLGIDIGGTSVKLGIVDEKGEILDRASFPVDFDGYETPILKTVLARAEEFAGGRIRAGEIRAIGVSATGQIDVHTGTVVGAAGHIPNYVGSRIGDELGERFHLPVTVVNDANCALLGEQWLGGAKDLTDVIMVTLGTGVGGGILAGGRLLMGSRGLGGEIGHIIINEDGDECSCGNRGCFERYASTKELVHRVRERISEGGIRKELFQPATDMPDGKAIFDVLRVMGSDDTSDKTADFECLCREVDLWEDHIASGIVSLIHIFEPQKILIGGGVSAGGELLLAPIREKILSRVMPRFADSLVIEAAELKNDAGLIGAVYYAMLEGEKS